MALALLWVEGALQVEDVSDDGRDTAFVPYLVLSGPQSKHNWLLQIQYRAEDDNESLVIDLSAMFRLPCKLSRGTWTVR